MKNQTIFVIISGALCIIGGFMVDEKLTVTGLVTICVGAVGIISGAVARLFSIDL